MQFENIIVDSNNLYHRNFHTHKDLFTEVRGETVYTGGIYGFLISMKKIESIYLKEGGTVYFCFDNMSSTDNLRKGIDPDYKANRVKKEPAFYRGIDFLQIILANHSNHYKLIYKDAYEADDYVKPLIESIDKKENTMLVSNDLDWARALSNNVMWLKDGALWDKEKFFELNGYFPNENNLMIFKAFRGDKSDNIPNAVPRFPAKLIIRLMSDFDTLYDILESINEIDYLNDKQKKAILDAKSRLILNYQLVSYIDIKKEDLSSFTKECSFNSSLLSAIYKSLNFKISSLDSRLMGKFPTKEVFDFDSFEEVGRV
jgi:5'-3' exonuclease